MGPTPQSGERELALAYLTVSGASPLQVVDAAADAGFTAVTLRLSDGPGLPGPLITDAGLRARTAARLQARELTLLDVEVVRLRDDSPGPGDGLDAMLDAAAELRARHVLVVGQDPEPARTAASFATLADAAHARGLRAVLEFMAFSTVRTLAEACAIVEASGQPSAGILVDPLHLARSGGTPADVAALAAEHPGRFPYAQLCDGTEAGPGATRRALFDEAVTDRRLPGDGALPLCELLGALPAGVPLSVEAPTRALSRHGPDERARRALLAARGLLRLS